VRQSVIFSLSHQFFDYLLPERSRALANFLEWTLSMGEQSAEHLGYTSLPSSLAPKVLAKVHSLR